MQPLRHHFHYQATVLILSSVALLFASCHRHDKAMAPAVTSRDSIPGMVTRGVTTLVSDSGVVRYRIVAALWEVFDKMDPPRWSFEEGVYLEKFSDSLSVDATVSADTAYYYDESKLWELRGNVHIENLEGDIFDTSLLFWNQNTERVYSDAFIRIQKSDRIVTGRGFDSNQQFTAYTIRETQGSFPIEREALVAPADSIQEPVAEYPAEDSEESAPRTTE